MRGCFHAASLVFQGFWRGLGADLFRGLGVCKVIRVAAADAGLTVTFSLSNGRFPVVLWCAVGAGGGSGLVCFVWLVRVSLKSCSGAICWPLWLVVVLLWISDLLFENSIVCQVC